MRLVMARRCVLVPVPWFVFDVFLRFLYFGLFEVFPDTYILPRRLSRSVPDKVFSLCGVEPSSRRERQTGLRYSCAAVTHGAHVIGPLSVLPFATSAACCPAGVAVGPSLGTEPFLLSCTHIHVYEVNRPTFDRSRYLLERMVLCSCCTHPYAFAGIRGSVTGRSSACRSSFTGEVGGVYAAAVSPDVRGERGAVC